MKVISFMNMKGGVSKTTSALNLGYGLASKGFKILLIDLDPQGNSSKSLLHDDELPEKTIKEVIEKKCSFQDAVLHPQKYVSGNIDLLPATPTLFGTAAQITADITDAPHYRLKKVLDAIPDDAYDITIIDCPPTIDILTINAMLVSTLVIVPTTPDLYALEGLNQTLDNFKSLQANFQLPNKPMVLLTMVNRNQEQKQLICELKELPGVDVFETTIRYQAKPITSASLNKQVVCIDKADTGVGNDYNQFIEEIVNKLHLCANGEAKTND